MPSRRVNVGFAGQNFGIDLPSMSESGVEETQSVLAGIFPELKLTAGAKTTRGGRLGRQSLPVTPEVTFKQEKVAPQINVMQTASPNMTQNVGAPAPTPKPAVNISTEYGQSPTFFGHEDYWKNLEKGVSQKDILEYLDRTPSVLQGANVKGKGGLYDQIISGKVVYPASMGAAPSPTPAPAPAPTPKPAVNISTEYGQSPTFFGHEDYWKNLEKGVSQKDILEYLDRTPSVLQGANVKGKGGLYDQIISGKVVYPASMGAAPSPTPAPAPTPTPAPAQAPAPAPAPAKNLFEQIQEAGGLAAWAQKSQANGTAAPTAPTVFSRFLSNPRFRMGAVSGRTLTY